MDEKNRFLESYKEKIALQEDNNQDIGTEPKEGEVSSIDGNKEGLKDGNLPPLENTKGADPGVKGVKAAGGLKYEQKSGFVKPEILKKTGPLKGLDKKKLGIFIGSGVGLLAAIIITILLILNRGVEVINLVGWSENDAQLWANDNGLLLQTEQEYNDEFEAGKIISQDIPEGTKVKKRSFIKLTVSMGHDLSVTLPLPDLMNMTKEQVEAWAAENFMAKVRITAELSDDVPVGHVIRYEINDETVVDEISRNTPIYIIVSKGPEDESSITVEIPNFKEMAIAECYAFANENGLNLLVKEQHDDYIPAGSVISQSVKPEEKVPKGSEITLVVSKGKLILIPDFSGYTQDRATTLAGELGIPISIKERYSGASAGSFISQSLKAGSEYKEGDILELLYSIDNKIVIASFVGQTRDALETWAKELNDQGASISINASTTLSNSPKGTILTQDKANSVIGVKTTINITVSRGKVLYVPDFVAPSGSGYDIAVTREKAIAMCEELNIVPIFKEAAKSGRLPGEIWSQSIEAGKEISEGSTITLKYVPANAKVTVPNFIGMTKSKAESGDYNKKFYIIFEMGSEYVEGSEGKVVKQSLNPNTKTASGSTVTLTIGPEGFTEPPPEETEG